MKLYLYQCENEREKPFSGYVTWDVTQFFVGIPQLLIAKAIITVLCWLANMESNVLEPLMTIEEINQNWIEKMLSLKYKTPVKVISWNLRLPSERQGYMSEIAFLKLVYSVDGSTPSELQLVFKVLPKDPKILQFMANGGLVKREVEFYRFINLPEFQNICVKSGIVLPIAETFYAGYKENAISILLRDLSIDKYKCVIVKEGSSLSQTKVALQAVAKIHAVGLLYLKKFGESNDNLTVLGSKFSVEFYNQYLVPNMKTLVKMTEGTSLSQAMMSLLPDGRSLFKLNLRYPFVKTLIHGDMWAGQLLFSDDETKATVVDWQFCRIDNPVLDIQSMLFMSTDPEVLENHLDEILTSYWDALSHMVMSLGISLDVTYEQFRKNVDDLWMYGFGYLTASIHDFLAGGDITEDRILGALYFLEKKGAFTKFINLIESENIA